MIYIYMIYIYMIYIHIHNTYIIHISRYWILHFLHGSAPFQEDVGVSRPFDRLAQPLGGSRASNT